MISAISVLMPVHNGGAYLKAAVTSILSQRDVEVELIIVDDHSTDRAINDLMINQDRRITLIDSTVRGIIPALNLGLQDAKHSLVARMDADDIAHPDRLRTQLQYLHLNPEVDICGAEVNIFTDQGEVAQGYEHYQQWINSLHSHTCIVREMFIESPIPHPTAVYRKDTILELGAYQDNGWPEDYDLWCRALLADLSFGKPKGVLLEWRDWQGRSSRLDDRYSKANFLRCKAHYLSKLLSKRSLRSVAIWGAGPTGLKLHDLLEQNGLNVSYFWDVNPKMQNRRKRNKTIKMVPELTAKPTSTELLRTLFKDRENFLIVAVSARGARANIRRYLQAIKLSEGADYLFAS